MPKLAFGSVCFFFFLRTFHRWVGHVFIVYTVPNLRVARILSYWMRYFLDISCLYPRRYQRKTVIKDYPLSYLISPHLLDKW